MVMLALRVPLEEGETPASHASRLAARNGLDAVRPFCLDMGFTFQQVIDGDDEALRRLTELGDVSLDALRKYAIRRDEDGGFTLGCERLVKQSLRRQRVHVCPACLSDDIATSNLRPEIAVYGRTSWLIAPLRTCPHHDLALVEVASNPAPGQLLDFTPLVKPALSRLAELTGTAVRRPFSAFEAYLLNRLEEGPGCSSWLDRLGFYTATKVCEMFGAVVLFGRTPNLDTLSDDEWAKAGAAGYEIAQNGEAGIRDFLSRLQNGEGIELKGPTGPKKMFGRIYEWLSEGGAYEEINPVRELVGRHILETIPLGPGDMLFGKPVERRLVHSVRTASVETGLHPKRLRKILAQAGLVSSRETGLLDAHGIFDASAVAPLLKQIKDSLPLLEVQSYLNVPRVHAQMLVQHGLIKAVIEGEGIGSTYARSDLDAFMGRLLAKAVPVDTIGDGQADIPVAMKRACCTAVEIVQLILDGRLSWVGRLTTESGYLSAVVDVEEIRHHVRGEDHGGHTLRQVELDLGVPTAAVKALAAHGLLQTRVVMNPVNRCKQTVVTKEDYAKFKREIVSLRNLSAETGIASRRLMRELAERGVPPAFDVERIGAYFYRRDCLTG